MPPGPSTISSTALKLRDEHVLANHEKELAAERIKSANLRRTIDDNHKSIYDIQNRVQRLADSLGFRDLWEAQVAVDEAVGQGFVGFRECLERARRVEVMQETVRDQEKDRVALVEMVSLHRSETESERTRAEDLQTELSTLQKQHSLLQEQHSHLQKQYDDLLAKKETLGKRFAADYKKFSRLKRWLGCEGEFEHEREAVLKAGRYDLVFKAAGGGRDEAALKKVEDNIIVKTRRKQALLAQAEGAPSPYPPLEATEIGDGGTPLVKQAIPSEASFEVLFGDPSSSTNPALVAQPNSQPAIHGARTDEPTSYTIPWRFSSSPAPNNVPSPSPFRTVKVKEEEMPNVGFEVNSKAEGSSLTVGGSTSKAGESSSKAGESSLKAGASSSKAEADESCLKVGQSSSKAGQSSSKAGESSAKPGASSSKVGKSSSKADSSSNANVSSKKGGNVASASLQVSSAALQSSSIKTSNKRSCTPATRTRTPAHQTPVSHSAHTPTPAGKTSTSTRVPLLMQLIPNGNTPTPTATPHSPKGKAKAAINILEEVPESPPRVALVKRMHKRKTPAVVAGNSSETEEDTQATDYISPTSPRIVQPALRNVAPTKAGNPTTTSTQRGNADVEIPHSSDTEDDSEASPTPPFPSSAQPSSSRAMAQPSAFRDSAASAKTPLTHQPRPSSKSANDNGKDDAAPTLSQLLAPTYGCFSTPFTKAAGAGEGYADDDGEVMGVERPKKRKRVGGGEIGLSAAKENWAQDNESGKRQGGKAKAIASTPVNAPRPSAQKRIEDYSAYKGRGRYAAAKQAGHTTINSLYAINPTENSGLDYQFDEVVRGREKRRRMDAGDCESCRDYYEAVGPLPARLQPPLWRSPTNSPTGKCLHHHRPHSSERTSNSNASPSTSSSHAVDAHKKAISRHRHTWARASTPPGYWNIGFPNTQEVDVINKKAAEMHRRKMVEVERGVEVGKWKRRG